jgi:glycosyltransferase involved in cell wall biosynthesis
VQNEETLAQLPKTVRARAWILNHVAFTETPAIVPRQRKHHILYFGGLVSRKGPTLAVRSLAHTANDIHLRIAGDGPERSRLQRLAQRLNVSDRVEFLGSVSRESVFELLSEAAAAVFTGLREEGGMALAEAMLSGTPVIVLAHGGARTVAASSTDPKRVMLIQPGSVKQTTQRIAAAMTHFSRNPVSSTGPTIDQGLAHSFLRDRFEEAMLSQCAERKSEMPTKCSTNAETA